MPRGRHVAIFACAPVTSISLSLKNNWDTKFSPSVALNCSSQVLVTIVGLPILGNDRVSDLRDDLETELSHLVHFYCSEPQ